MTRASDQQRKQRQKEFKEKQEHQKLLKAASKKTKPVSGKKEEPDKMPHTED